MVVCNNTGQVLLRFISKHGINESRLHMITFQCSILSCLLAVYINNNQVKLSKVTD